MELITKMEGTDREVTSVYDFGEETGGFNGLRGSLTAKGVPEDKVDDIIASHAIANMKVGVRAIVKAGMKATKDRGPLTDDQIQEKLDKHVFGLAVEKEAKPLPKDKLMAQLKALYADMTDEEKAAEKERLQALLAVK